MKSGQWCFVVKMIDVLSSVKIAEACINLMACSRRCLSLNSKSTGLFVLNAALGGPVSHHLCKIRWRHARELNFTRLIGDIMLKNICKI